MKTPLDTRGGRANDGKSARLGKKQPDGTHAHRIAHPRRSCGSCRLEKAVGRGGRGRSRWSRSVAVVAVGRGRSRSVAVVAVGRGGRGVRGQRLGLR
jgi:hypothetical protein